MLQFSYQGPLNFSKTLQHLSVRSRWRYFQKWSHLSAEFRPMRNFEAGGNKMIHLCKDISVSKLKYVLSFIMWCHLHLPQHSIFTAFEKSWPTSVSSNKWCSDRVLSAQTYIYRILHSRNSVKRKKKYSYTFYLFHILIPYTYSYNWFYH